MKVDSTFKTEIVLQFVITTHLEIPTLAIVTHALLIVYHAHQLTNAPNAMQHLYFGMVNVKNVMKVNLSLMESVLLALIHAEHAMDQVKLVAQHAKKATI